LSLLTSSFIIEILANCLVSRPQVKGLTPRGEISPRKQNAPNSAMSWGLWVCETCFAKKSANQDCSQSTMNTLAASENSLVSTITMIHEVLGTLTYCHLFRVGPSP